MVLALLAGEAMAQPEVPKNGKVAQEPSPAEDLARLRGMLSQPGADGRQAREMAIERLLGMPSPAAHRVLQLVLATNPDVDAVPQSILMALQRHLFGSPETLFGAAGRTERAEIVAGYVAVLSTFWRGAAEPSLDALREPARTTLLTLPVRDLEGAFRVLLAGADPGDKVALLRCIADMQQVHLGQLLAEYLDAADTTVSTAARQSLRLLTFRDEDFASRAQFAAWFEKNRDVRYFDLAERAARGLPELVRRERAQLERMRIDAAVQVVSAYTTRAPGFDWAAIHARTLVDDANVLDACLLVLQKALAPGLPPDSQGPARVAFCRALLQRWRELAPDQGVRRSLLLEVAAHTARPDETELVTELTVLLTTQLEAPTVEEQTAALRGLECFPTVESRTRILRYALAHLPRGAAAKTQLTAALATLSSRRTPRWYAPASTDADKPFWLELVRGIGAAEALPELRDAALALALTLDAKDLRVPEVFGILLDLAKDPQKDVKFRTACLFQLRGWRDQPGSADLWVQALHELLADPKPELRQLAAESLSMLTESVDSRKQVWIQSSITALRDRLLNEPSPAVLKAMVDSLQICGKEPQMPEVAIGALNMVMAQIGWPVPPEHEFRREPLLLALAALAVDPGPVGSQWLGACNQLLQHKKRDSLRLILQNHAAVELAPDVGSADTALADRARGAMKVLIRTALLKPPRDGWKSTDELQREARDVGTAFAALDRLDEATRLDEPRHRLLRLEVELAGGRYQDVVQRATAWLANGTPNPAPGGVAQVAITAEQKDRMRVLLAEAQIELDKPDAASKTIAEREGDQPSDARVLELQTRIGKALSGTDPVRAVELFERVLKATPLEDAAFRARLMDWATARVRHDPTARAAVWGEIERHAVLFDAQECPVELREAFQNIRAQH